MKKEDVAGLFVYLIIFAFAIVFGLTVLKDYASTWSNGGVFFAYILGAILTGLVFNAILFEFGHWLGAKVGRYDVISINVLGFMFYKKEGKRKFKFANFDGLTGETKIVPKKDAKKEPNPTPYLLFGTLFFVVEMIIVLTLFIVLSNISKSKNTPEAAVAYFLLVVGVIGLMVLIYNIIPLRLDTETDGYRIRLVSNPKNKEAFNELLRVQHAIETGEKDVEVKTFETITNFTAELNLNKVYVLFDKGQFKEAEPYVDTILGAQENISNKTYIRAKAQKIYINIMTKSLEEAQEFYDKEVPVSERREISTDVSMASIRAYLLMSGLLDKSLSETELALNNVLKAFKRTNKNRQPVELKLYNEALQRVIEAHPTWNLEGYLLQEVKEEKKDNNEDNK